MIKIGVIGGAGYTAGELLRILIHHPEVEIVFVTSNSNAGNAVADVHSGLIGETDLTLLQSSGSIKLMHCFYVRLTATVKNSWMIMKCHKS